MEKNEPNKKTVEMVSKLIAIAIGGSFVYWMITLLNF